MGYILDSLGNISARSFLEDAVQFIIARVAGGIQGLDNDFLKHTGGGMGGEKGQDSQGNVIYTE